MLAAGKHADILRGSFRVLRDRASLVHILVHFALRSIALLPRQSQPASSLSRHLL